MSFMLIIFVLNKTVVSVLLIYFFYGKSGYLIISESKQDKGTKQYRDGYRDACNHIGSCVKQLHNHFIVVSNRLSRYKDQQLLQRSDFFYFDCFNKKKLIILSFTFCHLIFYSISFDDVLVFRSGVVSVSVRDVLIRSIGLGSGPIWAFFH